MHWRRLTRCRPARVPQGGYPGCGRGRGALKRCVAAQRALWERSLGWAAVTPAEAAAAGLPVAPQ